MPPEPRDADDPLDDTGDVEQAQGPEPRLRLDLPIVLPDVDDEKDPCVARLIERVAPRRGVLRAHVATGDEADSERAGADEGAGEAGGDGPGAKLCIHYDPELLPLSEIRRLVEAAGAEVTQRYQHDTFWVRGMDCADCSLSVEHIIGRQDGVIQVSVNYAAERARVEYDTHAISRERIVGLIDSMGYEVHDREDRAGGHDHGPLEGLVLPLVSGVALATGFFGEWLFALPFAYALPLYVVAYVTGGYDAARHAAAVVRNLTVDVDALMVVAALGAAVLGHWAEGALLLFLFSMGHALEHRAMDKARNAISALGQLTPRTARVRRDDDERELPVEEVVRGDVVVVRPGERIPVDGAVREGESVVDQAAITGESIPVDKRPGDEVFAGTVNGANALEVEVTKLAKDTTIRRVIQLVEEAQTQKSPTQRFSERLERRFVPTVFVATAVVMAVPPLVASFGPWTGGLALLDAVALPWRTSVFRGLAVLVAASPCALALSTPAAVLSAIGKGARHGVLVKGGVHLENLAAVNAVAFDKTGTITFGSPELVDIITLDGGDEGELLRTAASLEARSEHPLAQAVVREAQARGIALDRAGALESITGKGVVGQVGSRRVEIGSLRLFQPDEATKARGPGAAGATSGAHRDGVPSDVAATAQALEDQGRTVVLVRVEGRFVGVLGLADRARDEARAVVERLKDLGVEHVIMLTGDNERVARAIADEVGFTEVRAGLLPEDKVAAVDELQARYGRVAMVGDGVNDAPAMARASVGVAMGAGGTDVALETADVALMGDRIDRLPFAFALSRRTRRVIWQNLVVSLGIIVVLVPLAALGLASIGPAVAVHEGSTLLVVGNALRLLGGPTP